MDKTGINEQSRIKISQEIYMKISNVKHRNERGVLKMKLRGKLISSIGILTFLAVFLLSLLSNVSLRFAYNNVITAEKE